MCARQRLFWVLSWEKNGPCVRATGLESPSLQNASGRGESTDRALDSTVGFRREEEAPHQNCRPH